MTCLLHLGLASDKGTPQWLAELTWNAVCLRIYLRKSRFKFHHGLVAALKACF